MALPLSWSANATAVASDNQPIKPEDSDADDSSSHSGTPNDQSKETKIALKNNNSSSSG